jgi:hypothetical protein
VLESERFVGWLERLLPGIADGRAAALFAPAAVSDSTDGQIAHLHRPNLSRAFCWSRLADALPAGDPRIPVMRAAARRHADASPPHVVGRDCAVEHWLAA